MLWLIFGLAVLAMLAVDLGVFHRRPHEITFREALGWSAAWFAAALAFMWVVYFWRSSAHAFAFLTAYLVEWSLSADNVFVFLVIFQYFQVPRAHQHKVLFWGIVGAVVLRAVMITVGIVLINAIHWVVYFFGLFIVVTGVHLAFQRDEEIHPERNPVFKLVRRVVPMTPAYQGDRFFVRGEGGQGRERAGTGRSGWLATPLFLVLWVVNWTDVAFAVDSVPAVLAITTDPFIVITSNVFAIIGLRSLYFLLAGIMPLFHFLKYGLSVILVFIGAKMVLSDVWPIPNAAALGVVAVALVASVALSLLLPPRGHSGHSGDSGRGGHSTRSQNHP
jgi:tellurite resistance protein TerC